MMFFRLVACKCIVMLSPPTSLLLHAISTSPHTTLLLPQTSPQPPVLCPTPPFLPDSSSSRTQNELIELSYSHITTLSLYTPSKMANKELLTKVQRMVPPMLEKFHKGMVISPVGITSCFRTLGFFDTRRKCADGQKC